MPVVFKKTVIVCCWTQNWNCLFVVVLIKVKLCFFLSQKTKTLFSCNIVFFYSKNRNFLMLTQRTDIVCCRILLDLKLPVVFKKNVIVCCWTQKLKLSVCCGALVKVKLYVFFLSQKTKILFSCNIVFFYAKNWNYVIVYPKRNCLSVPLWL